MFKFSVVVLLYSFLVALTWAGPTGRIVGGDNAAAGQFPYQISLRKYGSHTCGGSIISENYILTAAHCVTEETSGGKGFKVSNAKMFSIRAGSINKSKDGVTVPVASIQVHENYGNFLNDVALLKLAQPLALSKTIEAIPLARAEIPVNENVVISGWGRIETGGSSPTLLKYNILQTIPTLTCSMKVGMNAKTLLCLGHKAGDGACNGDSGGPAVSNGELVGVAGFVVGGCGSNNPDGYAKVSYHLDWIKKNCDDKLQAL